MIARLLILAAALALPTSPAAAQELAPVQLLVELRTVTFTVDRDGLPVRRMEADATVGVAVDPWWLDVRVRTSEGTLECYNRVRLIPNETAALFCMGLFPSPPLSAVSRVTAEVRPGNARRCEKLSQPNVVFICNVQRPG